MHLKGIIILSVVAALAVAAYAQDLNDDDEYGADLYSDENSYLVRRLNPPGVYPNAGDPNYKAKATHAPVPDPARFKGKNPPGVYPNAGPQHQGHGQLHQGGGRDEHPDQGGSPGGADSNKLQRGGHAGRGGGGGGGGAGSLFHLNSAMIKSWVSANGPQTKPQPDGPRITGGRGEISSRVRSNE